MGDDIAKPSFEYLDEESIDHELKCAICYCPFTSPVCNLTCGHTFCEECIKQSLNNSSNCPTCRRHANIRSFTLVKTRAILNQLSRLRVKCNLCQQMNIEDRQKHLETCPKQIIKCASTDLQCQWKGKREDFDNHLERCSFQQIRPIINELKQQIETIGETQCKQQRFIQAFINNGYTLSNICIATSCLLNRPNIANRASSIRCSLCNEKTHLRDISLHSCVTFTCICQSCFDEYDQELSKVTPKRELSKVTPKRELSSSESLTESPSEESDDEN